MFSTLVEQSSLFEVCTPPSFALTVFRLAPKATKGLSLEELNKVNRTLYQRLSGRGDITITATDLLGMYCIR